MASIGINRVVDGVLTSADTARLSITNSAGVILVLSVVVSPTSAGVYSYDVSALPAGTYTEQWIFQVTGRADDIFSRVFTIDSPLAGTKGITLAQIERAVARRVGPFHSLTAASGGQTSVIVNKLRSSLAVGDYEDMFLLRRGILTAGGLISGFLDDDRQRSVASYDNTSGTLTPDYQWTNQPILGERIELHALDPEEELRYACQDGLRRCYFKDVLTVSTTTNLRQVNLSALAPWMTRSEQVLRVEYGRLSSTVLPERADWFEPYTSGGDVWLRALVPYVGSTLVTVLRPHSSLVNGVTSYVGPDSDNDVLNIDREYAVLAGWLHAWLNFPARLQPLSVAGLQVGPKDVAAAFAIRSRALCPPEPDIIQNRFGVSDILTETQIGNG